MIKMVIHRNFVTCTVFISRRIGCVTKLADVRPEQMTGHDEAYPTPQPACPAPGAHSVVQFFTHTSATTYWSHALDYRRPNPTRRQPRDVAVCLSVCLSARLCLSPRDEYRKKRKESASTIVPYRINSVSGVFRGEVGACAWHFFQSKKKLTKNQNKRNGVGQASRLSPHRLKVKKNINLTATGTEWVRRG